MGGGRIVVAAVDDGTVEDTGMAELGGNSDNDEIPPDARWAEFMEGNEGGVSSSSPSASDPPPGSPPPRPPPLPSLSPSNDIVGIAGVWMACVAEGVDFGVASGEGVPDEEEGPSRGVFAADEADGFWAEVQVDEGDKGLQIGRASKSEKAIVGGVGVAEGGGFGGCLMKVERNGHMGRFFDEGLVPSAEDKRR